LRRFLKGWSSCKTVTVDDSCQFTVIGVRYNKIMFMMRNASSRVDIFLLWSQAVFTFFTNAPIMFLITDLQKYDI
jgi:hypothetical protein